MPFFSLSLKIFATLGITQVNLISALAYSKKSLHWDSLCSFGHSNRVSLHCGIHTLVVYFCVRSLTVCLLLGSTHSQCGFFVGNVMVVWIFFVNFVVEMLMDNRR